MTNTGKKRFFYSLKYFRLGINRKIDKRWTLIRRLGAGGNGEVWLCRDLDGTEYAIKFLKYAYKEPYSRFYDEVTFMESFGNIDGVLPIISKNAPVGVSQYTKTKSPYYYVMPLAASLGSDLYNESIERKTEIIRSLLEMLVSLHKQKIAHRDIKPANILLYQGQYVLSDFGLVFFQGKTSKTVQNRPLGAKWTRSPQMERDAGAADGFKSDVYAMAKTIWMIFTGDFTSFEGQYDASSSFLSLRRHIPEKYVTPLEDLLTRCTDHEEGRRPTAQEFLDEFVDWIDINNDWDRENLLQWVEVHKKIFPLHEPDHAEWENLSRMVGILNILGSYQSLNHLFFPGGGGLDLTGASLSDEKETVELDFGGLRYLVCPKRLVFERMSDDFQWNYFRLELKVVEPRFKEYMVDDYLEEYGSVTYANGSVDAISLRKFDELDSTEVEKLKARRVSRFLKGSMVIFHKDSFYNQLVSRYRGEHDKMPADEFKRQISALSQKMKGKTITDIRNSK